MSRGDPCRSVRVACMPRFDRIRRVVATGANRSHYANLVGMGEKAPADHGGTVFDPASVRWGRTALLRCCCAPVLVLDDLGPERLRLDGRRAGAEGTVCGNAG